MNEGERVYINTPSSLLQVHPPAPTPHWSVLHLASFLSEIPHSQRFPTLPDTSSLMHVFIQKDASFATSINVEITVVF